jgi:hypothetical protein
MAKRCNLIACGFSRKDRKEFRRAKFTTPLFPILNHLTIWDMGFVKAGQGE